MSFTKRALKSLKWSFLQQISIQLIGFISSIVLTRLLTVEDFGIVGMITIFMTVGTVLIDSGLSISIIRSKSIDRISLNSVFVANTTFSLLFYSIIFVSAPKIATFFEQPVLVSVVRIQALSLIISSLFTIQKAILTRNLEFKKITIVTVLAVVVSYSIGIIMAYLNYSFWSIVVMNIVYTLVSLLMFYYYSSWRPNLSFSLNVLKKHLKFGYKLLTANLLDAFFANSYYAIIGKIYNPHTLGLYTKSDSLKKITVLGISTPLKNVLLPILREIQDDDDRLKFIYVFILQVAILVVSPILLFLIIYADQIIYILYGSDWVGAAPFFQMLCFASILYPISTYVVSFLIVKGRSDLVLKIESIKKIGVICALLIAWYTKDIYTLLKAQIIISVLDFIINTVALKSILNISYKFQLTKILKVLCMTFLSSIILYTLLKSLFVDYTATLWSLIIGTILFPILNTINLYLINPELFNQIKEKLINKNK